MMTLREIGQKVGGAITFWHKPMVKTVRISFEDAAFRSMRDHLLRGDGQERVSILLCGLRGDSGIKELYVRKVINIQDQDYDKQSNVYVLPTMEKQIEIFRLFADGETVVFVHVHSHPFTRFPQFSAIDDRSAVSTVRSLVNYRAARNVSADFYFGRLVFGTEPGGFEGELYDSQFRLLDEISVIRTVGYAGINELISYKLQDGAEKETATQNMGMLERNIRWLGMDGQRKLSSLKVGVIGVGGVGANVAYQLRGLGVGSVLLLDADCVEEHNLNRLVSASLADIGQPKVLVAGKMIEEGSERTEVETLQAMFRYGDATIEKAVLDCDVIFSCVDSFNIRGDVNLLAARYMKPLIDIGAGIDMIRDSGEIRSIGGQISFYAPGGPCLCCQGTVPRHIESEASKEIQRASGYVKGTNITPTSVVSIVSIMAGLAIDTFIKFATGFSVPNTHVRCELRDTSLRVFNFQKKPSCLICGDNGVEGLGIETEATLRCDKQLSI